MRQRDKKSPGPPFFSLSPPKPPLTYEIEEVIELHGDNGYLAVIFTYRDRPPAFGRCFYCLLKGSSYVWTLLTFCLQPEARQINIWNLLARTILEPSFDFSTGHSVTKAMNQVSFKAMTLAS